MSSFKVLKTQCIDVSDEALEAVGTSCLLLELLVIYNLQRFTDRLPQLCSLDVLLNLSSKKPIKVQLARGGPGI
nr:hypothetical protein CFP56_47838 [Quercus suber]